MKRWLRGVLRRYGIELPFTSVICPEDVKSIRFDADGCAEVVVRRTLVFLEVPKPGDLHEVVPVDPDDTESRIEESPDGWEIARVPIRGGTRVYWKPREPIVPYALYGHQYGWRVPGSYGQAALYTELACEVRTGILALEVITPEPIETVVTFKRPRWRRMRTERSLVKYALTQLEQQGEKPVISDEGQRVVWTLTAPSVGDRYVCVLFTPDGISQWQKRLAATSLSGRLRRLVQSVVSPT